MYYKLGCVYNIYIYIHHHKPILETYIINLYHKPLLQTYLTNLNKNNTSTCWGSAQGPLLGPHAPRIAHGRRHGSVHNDIGWHLAWSSWGINIYMSMYDQVCVYGMSVSRIVSWVYIYMCVYMSLYVTICHYMYIIVHTY